MYNIIVRAPHPTFFLKKKILTFFLKKGGSKI